MQLKIQKRLAAQILKRSENNIRLDPSRLEEIKEAITKADIKSLIKDRAITERGAKGISSYRINKKRLQKSKGRKSGVGSIKGSKGARRGKKGAWIRSVRAQRGFLKLLRDKKIIPDNEYRPLYMKIKGGFFRSKRHIKVYMKERGIIK
ncbi:50S ribosomal protein L19e [Candidatus Woesearchaeota archaeon]|nr:50S ribosomal protein L19e [Candidatus Woesearchaeota archaeon]